MLITRQITAGYQGGNTTPASSVSIAGNSEFAENFVVPGGVTARQIALAFTKAAAQGYYMTSVGGQGTVNTNAADGSGGDVFPIPAGAAETFARTSLADDPPLAADVTTAYLDNDTTSPTLSAVPNSILTSHVDNVTVAPTAQPTGGARKLTATVADYGSTPGTIVVIGLDEDGSAQTETLSIASASLVAGTKYWTSITSLAISNMAGTHAVVGVAAKTGTDITISIRVLMDN